MSITLLFDIEGNAKRAWEVTKVHCISIQRDTDKEPVLYGPDDIDSAIDQLKEADVVVAHNAVMYDVPVLKRLYNLTPKKVYDTILVSRILYPDHTQNPIKGHSLKNWGEYLGCHKGDFNGPWDTYTDEMGEYCLQDVVVLKAIYDEQKRWYNKLRNAIALEHRIAEIIYRQIEHGVGFRRDWAEKILNRLTRFTDDIEHKLHELFPPIQEEIKTPQYWEGDKPVPNDDGSVDWVRMRFRTKGEALKERCPVSSIKCGPNKIKEIPLNCGSRTQIGERLIAKYNWKPTRFTATGKPQIDEKVLSDLSYPEATLFNKYLMVGKKVSMIQSWLESDEGGVIHGNVITNGTVTGRMSHSGPNLGQVPSSNKQLGKICRRCFAPKTPGRVMVGGDISGLELNLLGHYLFPYDKGAFLKILKDGDIHTQIKNIVNNILDESESITRADAKNVVYAILYGASAKKVARMLNISKPKGAKVREKIKQGIPGLTKLLNEIEIGVKRNGWLPGLDGRRLPIRSPYLALNTLIQSAGGLIAKLAWILADERFHKSLPDGCWDKMLNVHDEAQYECEPGHADQLGSILGDAFAEAGKRFKLKCPIGGEYKIGPTWRHTH